MLRPSFLMQNLETAFRTEIHDHVRIRLPAGNPETSFIDSREMVAAGLPKAYVNVQLLINVVARLGLADTVTEQLTRLLGRPSAPWPPVCMATVKHGSAADGVGQADQSFRTGPIRDPGHSEWLLAGRRGSRPFPRKARP